MSLFVKTLASSSKGNSAIVYSDRTRLLVDAGISFSRIKKELDSINMDINSLTAILITHAHSDHVRALPMLLSKTNIPIFCSKRTHLALQRRRDFSGAAELLDRLNFFEGNVLTFEDIFVESYPFPHGGWLLSGQDHAGEHTCFKFNYSSGGENYSIGYATDLGHFPEDLIKPYFNCDFYVLESNHDVVMQLNSDRPVGLIKRNLSNIGHLSNDQAADTLVKLIHPDPELRRTRNVLLAHLSRDCNCRDLARTLISTRLTAKMMSDVSIKVAPFDEPSETFCVFR